MLLTQLRFHHMTICARVQHTNPCPKVYDNHFKTQSNGTDHRLSLRCC
jgi:hypothetical protein